MRRLLAAELLKLRTTRTFVALVGTTVALSLVAVALTTLLVDDIATEDPANVYNTDFSSLFVAVLGIIGITGEWRHRTITSSILAMPDRIRFLMAKALAYSVAGVVMSAAVTLATFGLGIAIVAGRDAPTPEVAELADILWRNLLVAGLVGALGVGIGGVVRNQVVAVIGVLALAMAIEPLVLGLAPEVGRYGFTTGAPNAIFGVDWIVDEDALPVPAAIAVMCGWVALFLATAAVLLRRRDLT